MISLDLPPDRAVPADQVDWASALSGVDHVIVDFDETLLLTNSTEAYLGAARPLHLVFLICKVIDALRLWTFLPGANKRHVYRDWLRVVFVTILMPWHYLAWRHSLARTTAETFANATLLAALQNSSARKTVASLGFSFIVKPMVERISPGYATYAGSFWTGFSNRRAGKLRLLQQHLSSDYIRDSAVVTDSLNDADLLNFCRKPLFVLWENAKVANIFSRVYLPFLYTEKVKRRGRKYMLRGVLLQDCVALCLAYAWLLPNPFYGCVAIIAFHLALWCIYELGYFDNDRAAVENEENGTINAEYFQYVGRMSIVGAWVAAALLTAFGAFA